MIVTDSDSAVSITTATVCISVCWLGMVDGAGVKCLRTHTQNKPHNHTQWLCYICVYLYLLSLFVDDFPA
ncbi:hypothetical protein QTP86_000910 [Hemibagrus guttatus]|nr:hypothetical protein QTP86_000910 [Hemibagrus guttatus]